MTPATAGQTATRRRANTVRERNDLPATSPDTDPGYPRTGQDWAAWLRDAHHAQLPGDPLPSSGDAKTAWAALTHLARREGFTVERANCAGADGFTTWRNRKIQIRPDTPPAQAVIALAHQLGHVLLHGQIARLEPSASVPCSGIRRVEADSVAYLAATYIGIDAAVITFPHVTSWAGTDPRAHPAATIQAVTTRILAATATITARFEAADLGPEQLPPPGRPTSRRETSQPVEPLIPEGDHARIHNDATRFFRSQLPDSWVPGYLARRGLPAVVQDQWQAGCAPAGWDTLTRHLTAAGYPETLIEAVGLARRSRRGTLIDTFRDRAMLPIRTPDGTITAFIGRANEHARPGTPKYLNSPGNSHYSKSQILFGLWEARDALASGARPVIVEGPLDAIAVTTAGQGTHVGVAPCGTALTASHIAALAQTANLRATGITVAFDPDDAGQRAAVRACHLLAPVTDKMAAARLPAGQDPAQILANSGPAALAAALTANTRPLPDLVTDTIALQWRSRLDYAEGQIGALRAAAPLIAALPPAHVARQVARLAAFLRLDHATVTQAVTDALTTLISTQAADTGPKATTPRAELRGPPSTAARATHSNHPISVQEDTKAGTQTSLASALTSRAATDRESARRRMRR
jgi:DNA primase catalytic core